MKKLIVVGIGILMLTVVNVNAQEPDGFMGLKWTKSVKSAISEGLCDNSDMTVHGSIFCLGFKKFIGDIPVKIVFYFDKDRFYTGSVYFDGLDNFERIGKALIAKYGKPTKEKESGMGWIFKDSRISLIFSSEQKLSDAILCYTNIHILKEILKRNESPTGKIESDL